MKARSDPQAIARSETPGAEPPPPVGPAARRAAEQEGVSLVSLKELAKAAAAPSGLIVALAFYFGWVRTESLALYFGIDPSTLGLSVQDYLLRSVDALFAPLGALLLVGVVAGSIHVQVSRWIERDRRPELAMGAAYALIAVGASLFLLGVVALLRGLPFGIHFLIPPLSPGVGITLVAYGLYMRRALLHRRGRLLPAAHSQIRSATAALIVLIIVLSLFWTVSEYAAALGRGRGVQIENGLTLLPGVTVYTRHNLQLGGVSQEVMEGEDAHFRYRYSGLRFLIRSGGNYFLLPEGWTRAEGFVVVLRDDDNIRVEFTRGPP